MWRLESWAHGWRSRLHTQKLQKGQYASSGWQQTVGRGAQGQEGGRGGLKGGGGVGWDPTPPMVRKF